MPMTEPIPSLGSTNWYAWATEIHNDVDAAVPDAPSDGNQYARKDAAWEQVVAGGGGGAASVASPNGFRGWPNFTFIGQSTIALTVNRTYGSMVHLPYDIYIQRVIAIVNSTTATTGVVRLGLYEWNGDVRDVTTLHSLHADFGTIDPTTVGQKTIDLTGAPVLVPAGLYTPIVGQVTDGAVTIGTANGVFPGLGSDYNAVVSNNWRWASEWQNTSDQSSEITGGWPATKSRSYMGSSVAGVTYGLGQLFLTEWTAA